MATGHSPPQQKPKGKKDQHETQAHQSLAVQQSSGSPAVVESSSLSRRQYYLIEGIRRLSSHKTYILVHYLVTYEDTV